MKSRRFKGTVLNGEFKLNNFKQEYLDLKFKIFAYYKYDNFEDFTIYEKKDGFYFVDFNRKYEGKLILIFVFRLIYDISQFESGGSLENLLESVYVNVHTNRGF